MLVNSCNGVIAATVHDSSTLQDSTVPSATRCGIYVVADVVAVDSGCMIVPEPPGTPL